MAAPKHVDAYEPGNMMVGGALEVKGALTVNGSAVAMAPGVTSDGDEGLIINEALSVGELATLTGGVLAGADIDVTGSVAASGSVTAFGAPDIGVKPAVTGAISGTPTATAVAGALKLLITALANAGFITDSTT